MNERTKYQVFTLATTAISCECDDADRAALRELARRRNTTVGKLVKQALDAAYANELADIKPFFAAESGQRNERRSNRKTTR